MSAALLTCGAASAQQASAQQASFAVAVTLHTTMSKPLSVAQLCSQQPKPVDMSGARIRVDCPAPEIGKGTVGGTMAAAARSAPPEVLVTF